MPINPATARIAPRIPPFDWTDEAAPVKGATVPVGPAAPPETVPEPDGIGAVVLPGIGNGGEVLSVVGAAVVLGDPEVLVDGAVKPAGSSMPLSEAQVFGSTPSGQQSPFVKQKEPDGQGSVRQDDQYESQFGLSL